MLFNCSEYSPDELERIVETAKQLTHSTSRDRVVIADVKREHDKIFVIVSNGDNKYEGYVE